jgi:hypothetical protein
VRKSVKRNSNSIRDDVYERATKELDATRAIIEALGPLSHDDRKKVLALTAIQLDIVSPDTVLEHLR